MKDIKITKELLLNNGFKEIFKEESYQKAYKEFWGIDDFFICQIWTEDESPIKIDMTYKITNNGTDWNMHLDNEDCETIGSADIDYVDQFNMMMQIFDSKFKLK